MSSSKQFWKKNRSYLPMGVTITPEGPAISLGRFQALLIYIYIYIYIYKRPFSQYKFRTWNLLISMHSVHCSTTCDVNGLRLNLTNRKLKFSSLKASNRYIRCLRRSAFRAAPCDSPFINSGMSVRWPRFTDKLPIHVVFNLLFWSFRRRITDRKNNKKAQHRSWHTAKCSMHFNRTWNEI